MDDISLFTTAKDKTAGELSHDLEMLKSWVRKGQTSFNKDSRKEAVELTLSKK